MRFMLILLVASMIAFEVIAQTPKKCNEFDTRGPYCTAAKDGEIMVDSMLDFCMRKGFNEFRFGNGPNDDKAYCGREDNGNGYRFNCCN